MGKPYSEDLRARVVRAAQDGATIPETAEQLRVSISSVVRFRRLHRETGSVSPAKFGGYKAEIKAVLATERVTVGRSSISRFLHHLNLRFKKKSTGRRAGPPGRRRRT
jgi:transposase